MTGTAGLLALAGLVVIGAAAGLGGRALARRRPGAVGAVLVGLVGSFAGGFAGYFVAAKPPGGGLPAEGWAGAAVGAAVAGLVVLATGRARRDPRS